jgi:purine-binding chemotaxis protein CheW
MRRDQLLQFAAEIDRAADVSVQPPVAELHLVTFTLDREEFAIPVTQVREVIRVGEITRVPQAPSHVRGVANLRGRILAVVELRTRLGLEPAVITPRSRIIVVEVGDRVLGLLVDAVLQVAKVPADTVTGAPDEVLTPQTDYITGVARWNSRLIILLELDKALLPQESPATRSER